MGVGGFYSFIKQQGLFKTVELKDTEIVIDMQNLSCHIINYRLKPKTCGPEYDIFEHELRKIFTAFQRNNVKCYPVFMGCREHADKTEESSLAKQEKDIKISREQTEPFKGRTVTPPPPILYREVAKSVLRDLGINFVTTAYDNHTDMKHIAKKLNCPILTQNSLFCHAGVPYIDLSTLKLQPVVTCEKFHITDLLCKFNLPFETYIFFYVMFDDVFYDHEFNFNEATKLLLRLGVSHKGVHKFSSMLTWLAKQKNKEMIMEKWKLATRPKVFETILKAIKAANEVLYSFDDVLKRNPSFIAVVNDAFELDIQFAENDPNWLVKSISIGNVPALFANLCKDFKVFFGSNQLEDFNQEDSFIPSLPILRYSFDLLNNFEENSFKLMSRTGTKANAIEITSKYSIPKPKSNVNLKNDGPILPQYFAHFIQNILPELDLCYVDTIPKELQMIVVGVAYYQMKINSDPIMVHSLILCHIFMASRKLVKLGIGEEVTSGEFNINYTWADVLVTDKKFSKFSKVPEEDWAKTYNCISEFNPPGEFSDDVKVLHKILQFQYCLQQLNFLNTLCGQKLAETKYENFINCPVWCNIYENLSNRKDTLDYCRKVLNDSRIICGYFDALNEVFENSVKKA